MTPQELRFSSDAGDVVARRMDAAVLEMRAARSARPSIANAGPLTSILSTFIDEVDQVLSAAETGVGQYGEKLRKVADGFSDVELQVCEAFNNQERTL